MASIFFMFWKGGEVSFTFSKLLIPDVLLITPRVFEDTRGFFFESYKASGFHAFGIEEDFVQDNHSRSSRGVLRGLHFQTPPHAQGKLVRVVIGTVWDVAVDLRRSSATFGRWVGAELSAENHEMLYIPPGFGHGFVTLSDTADFVYKCTTEYAPDNDAGVRWDDPSIGIEWPLSSVLVSEKDKQLPLLADAAVFD
jgi:dTDP-4-dehydrorhamnose 3,5-epimerase